MKSFRYKLNGESQAKYGDKKLRVDEEEILLSRHNGASTRKEKYRPHKDSYIRDTNNEVHGMSLRKLSLVIFLDDDIDNEDRGMLRLFPKGDTVVDISQRIGRAVLFKSEEMLH